MNMRIALLKCFLALFLVLAMAAHADDAAEGSGRKVHPGAAYGSAIFAGMFTGSLIGAAAGALPYAENRKNQDPNSVILGTVYGAVAGAIGLGTPCAAYEVASDKPGAADRIIFNTFGFSVLGGAVGAAAGTISYRNKVGRDDESGEDFLAATAGGVLVGAILGLGIGVVDGVFWVGPGSKVPGKGIHAKLGILQMASLRVTPQDSRPLPNITFGQLEF